MNAHPLNQPPNTTVSGRWRFNYARPNAPFNCQMRCMRCIAPVGPPNARRQCARVSCYTLPYCPQHLKLVAHLRIGRTRLIDPATQRRYRFKGLFACIPGQPIGALVFAANQPIVTYFGEHITQAQLDARYPGANETAPYVEEVLRTVYLPDPNPPHNPVLYYDQSSYIDGACMRGVAALANDSRNGACVGNDPCVANARLVSGDNNTYPWLTAVAPILNRQEIFVDYGPNYWGGTHHPHVTSPAAAYNRIEYKC